MYGLCVNIKCWDQLDIMIISSLTAGRPPAGSRASLLVSLSVTVKELADHALLADYVSLGLHYNHRPGLETN